LNEFKKHFRVSEEVELIALPSPSPAFMMMSFDEKVEKYKKIL
jgi:G:T/U-mismatch repair DNA glycosylase